VRLLKALLVIAGIAILGYLIGITISFVFIPVSKCEKSSNCRVDLGDLKQLRPF
jgi:hypothetical protein